jgi:hypothetical protein
MYEHAVGGSYIGTPPIDLPASTFLRQPSRVAQGWFALRASRIDFAVTRCRALAQRRRSRHHLKRSSAAQGRRR